MLDFGKNLESSNPKQNVFESVSRNIDTSALEPKDESPMDNSQVQDCKSLIYGLINKCKISGKTLSSKSNLYANNICELLDFSEKNSFGYEYSNL